MLNKGDETMIYFAERDFMNKASIKYILLVVRYFRFLKKFIDIKSPKAYKLEQNIYKII